MDIAGDFAGSYHVLEMGQQYAAYVRYCDQPPLFHFPIAIPSWSPAQRLIRRTRAADVTGNIGEIVAGLVAVRTFGARASEIAHLEARHQERTPDYLLVDSGGVQGFVSSLVGVDPTSLPLDWPLESKAWSHGGMDRDAIRDALRQLAAFWLDTRHGFPEGVGHGLIVGLALGRPRTVNVFVLVPRDRAALLAWFDDVESTAAQSGRSPAEELGSRIGGDGIQALTAFLRTADG